jgi:hypothetical protein
MILMKETAQVKGVSFRNVKIIACNSDIRHKVGNKDLNSLSKMVIIEKPTRFLAFVPTAIKEKFQ